MGTARSNHPKRNLEPWSIREGYAPSPRFYISTIRSWLKKDLAFRNSILENTKRAFPLSTLTKNGEFDFTEEESVRVANMLASNFIANQSRFPPPPNQEMLTIIGSPIVKKSIVGVQRDLVKAGAPPNVFLRMVDPSSFSKNLVGIDLFEAGLGRQELSEWAADGVSLIEKANTINKSELITSVVDAARNGRRWENIAREIKGSVDGLEWRARLIAQDQVAKINGKITQSMHEKAGIETFIWRSGLDNRVRKRHREVHGQEFSWKEGAPDVGFYHQAGFPGQCGRCRCVAQPVAPQWWKDL